MDFLATAITVLERKAITAVIALSGIKYYDIAAAYYRARREFDVHAYDDSIDPYEVIWVSPDQITRTTGRTVPVPYATRFEQIGTVESGEWDTTDKLALRPWRPERYGDNTWFIELLTAKQFEKSVLHRSMVDHFENNVPWRETTFYEEVADAVAAGKPRHQYLKDMDHFEETLEDIDRLYESVRTQGFKRRREFDRTPFWQLVADSVLIDIGRSGEPLFVEGRRRLSTAKLLDVSEVPVRIRTRHERWVGSS